MDRTDENGPEEDPEEGGNPAPDHGQGGSDNGTGSRNAGKVMSEDDALAGGNVVIAILHLDGGNPGCGVELEDLAGQEPAVCVVGHQVENEGAKSDGEGLHERKSKQGTGNSRQTNGPRPNPGYTSLFAGERASKTGFGT